MKIEYRDPKLLAFHPLNSAIYGDEPLDKAMVRDIKARGITQNLTVTPNGTILEGHRRAIHAIAAGLSEVPCVVVDLGDPVLEDAMVVQSNRTQREKTRSQKAREGLELERVIRQLQKLPPLNDLDFQTMKPIAAAAKKAEMKPTTYRKAKKALEKINKLREGCQDEEADALEATLDKSVHAAYKQVIDEDREDRRQTIHRVRGRSMRAIRAIEDDAQMIWSMSDQSKLYEPMLEKLEEFRVLLSDFFDDCIE